MTDNTLQEREAQLHEFRPDDIEKAQKVLSDLCSNQGRYFKMSIPVHRDDSDMVLSRVIKQAARAQPAPAAGDVERVARAMMRTVFHEIDVDKASLDWTGNDVWGCDFEEMAKAAIAALPSPSISEDEAVRLMIGGYVDEVHAPSDSLEAEQIARDVKADLGNAFAIAYRALLAAGVIRTTPNQSPAAACDTIEKLGL